MMDFFPRVESGVEEERKLVRIRTDKEIEQIGISNQIVADILDLLEKEIKPAVKILDLEKIAEDYILSKDARPAFKGYMGFPATLCISIDDEVVHGIPNKRVLEEGQIVSIDCGVEKNGYYGDSARTFSVGEISSEKAKLLKVTRESLAKGIEAAKPGNYVSDIGYAVQTYVESFGYSVVRELVGHGIGTELHEEPQIPNYGEPNRGDQLREGMCLAIEPMINMGKKEVKTDTDGWTVRTLDGKPSAHFEHSIAIMVDGAKILSLGALHG